MERRSRGISGAIVLIAAASWGAVACGSSAKREGFTSEDLPARTSSDAGEGGTTPSFARDGAVEASKPIPTSTDPVDVVFTADNAYAFGWGDATSLANFASRPNTSVAGDMGGLRDGRRAQPHQPWRSGADEGRRRGEDRAV